MAPNPTNTCVSCLRSRVDVTEGISRTSSIFRCRRCLRFASGPKAYMDCQLESAELMALCLKRIKGLKRVKLVDAAWIWQEEHSMRLKLRLTVMKEVGASLEASLQESFQVEFVIRNQQCPDCAATFANMAWKASVQVRQRVDHKRTFFFLEQAILKSEAQAAAVKIEQYRDGLDFYFKEKSDALRFVSFVEDVVPCRVKNSKKLVSADLNSNIFNHQFTSFVELAAACKDDLLFLDTKSARRLSMPRVCLVKSVHQSVRLVDPSTGHLAECNAEAYFRCEPSLVAHVRQLVTYVVLDVELVIEEEAEKNGGANPTAEKRQRKGSKTNHRRNWRTRGLVADVVLAKSTDLGRNDKQTTVTTHLGALLQAGDEVLGYDMTTLNLTVDVGENTPDVVLVRKSTAKQDRDWKLRREVFDETTEDAKKDDADYEHFLQQLESDKDMRSHVNLYRKSKTVTLTDTGEETRPDPNAIRLEELLEDIDIGADDDDDEL